MEAVTYEALRPGDLFRFDYSHHSEALYRPVWRKLDIGFESEDGSEWRPDLTRGVPMPLELVKLSH